MPDAAASWIMWSRPEYRWESWAAPNSLKTKQRTPHCQPQIPELPKNLTLYQNKYRIETTRLQNWDYASDGWYFITICTKGHECVLGEIQNGTMQLNKYGRIAEKCWFDLPNHYPNLILDEFVVMPDHLHGIMVIDNNRVETGLKPVSAANNERHEAETGLKPVSTIKHGIFEFIRAFKTFSTRRMNELDNMMGKSRWQTRFHDHIIHNEQELYRIREYIANNPKVWGKIQTCSCHE